MLQAAAVPGLVIKEGRRLLYGVSGRRHQETTGLLNRDGGCLQIIYSNCVPKKKKKTSEENLLVDDIFFRWCSFKKTASYCNNNTSPFDSNGIKLETKHLRVMYLKVG